MRPHECPHVPDQRPERGSRLGRACRETPLEPAERIGDAYGLVLLLIAVTFVVTMTRAVTNNGTKSASN